jgi:hypothetical protein
MGHTYTRGLTVGDHQIPDTSLSLSKPDQSDQSKGKPNEYKDRSVVRFAKRADHRLTNPTRNSRPGPGSRHPRIEPRPVGTEKPAAFSSSSITLFFYYYQRPSRLWVGQER